MTSHALSCQSASISAKRSAVTQSSAIIRVVAIIALLAALPFVGASAQAQASVTGHISLLETSTKPPKDLASGVVWLSPVSATDLRLDTIPRRTSIAMRSREFLPHVRVVAVGGAVEFPNQDPFSHNVFSNSELGKFDLGLYPRRATRATTVSKPGVYAVYCNIHARMVSFIIAVPGRHVAKVDNKGAFVFRDVSPGVYELHAWHERATESQTRVTVGASGAVTSIVLDARGFVPGPHLNKFGQTYPVTRADRY